MVQIIFCDTNPDFSNEIVNVFGTEVLNNYKLTTYTGDIRNLSSDNMAYISPANSWLFFSGGVDYIYSKMFPTIQGSAQRDVTKYKYTTENGRHYLPVGSAMIVPVFHEGLVVKNNYVIASPTMYVPSDIRYTRNVYYSFYATLAVIDKYNKSVDENISIKTVVCPGLGTGCGAMSFKESATQIKEAFYDFITNKNNNDLEKEDYMAYIYEIENEEN